MKLYLQSAYYMVGDQYMLVVTGIAQARSL